MRRWDFGTRRRTLAAAIIAMALLANLGAAREALGSTSGVDQITTGAAAMSLDTTAARMQIAGRVVRLGDRFVYQVTDVRIEIAPGVVSEFHFDEPLLVTPPAGKQTGAAE